MTQDDNQDLTETAASIAVDGAQEVQTAVATAVATEVSTVVDVSGEQAAAPIDLNKELMQSSAKQAAEYGTATHRGNVDIFMGEQTTLEQLETAYQDTRHALVMRGSYPLQDYKAGNPIQAFPGHVYVVHGIDVRLAPPDTIRTLQGMGVSPPAYAIVPGTYSAIRLESGREDVRDGVAPIDLLRIVQDNLKTGVGPTADLARRHLAEVIKCFE